MELNEFLKAVLGVPLYVWIILFIVLAFLFRDKTRWEKEVNFPHREGVGRGEVEIEYSKRTGTEIEVEMALESAYQNKSVLIYLNEELVCTVPPNKNDGNGRDYKQKCNLDKPAPGDKVKVVVEDEILFEGEFS